MGELPEKFPEYSIMYRTISNQIKSLQKQKEDVQDTTEIDSKITKYQEELNRIKKMFPDNFFEN
ncbi:hypothetical protein [Nitrosopumilus maritimus]|uniref:hypothetical protein n=1 Tax=Nitrosopumilus maritimus TaxID=338192 RepID=UPI000B1635F4|nr:hypothetical protein [Nitrosopumilus maritimus]